MSTELRSRRRAAWLGAFGALACLATSSSASADEPGCGPPTVCTPQTSVPPVTLAPPPSDWVLRLPIEIGGTTIFAHGGLAGFTGSFLPGVGWKALDFNVLASGIGRNPDGDKLRGDFGLGGRVSVAFTSVLEGAVSLRFAGQAEYLFWAEHARVAVSPFMVDVSSILRIGFWAGRDWAADAEYFNLTIGTDFATWHDPVGALLRAGPMEDFGNGTK